jgi:hypothetical protein
MSKGKSDKSYAELVRVLGSVAAEKLSLDMGGSRIYPGARVEINVVKDISVISSIGMKAAKTLYLELEELELHISQRGAILARNRMISKLIEAGWTRKQTARAVGLSERGVCLAIQQSLDSPA